MEQRPIKKFKRRWTKINALNDKEVKKLSIRQKFQQLNSVIRLAIGMQLDFTEDQEKNDVRSRWIFLKRGNT